MYNILSGLIEKNMNSTIGDSTIGNSNFISNFTEGIDDTDEFFYIK